MKTESDPFTRMRYLNELERPVKEFLHSFTYKPDWHFRTFDGMLIIEFWTTDTDDFKEKIKISFTRQIPDFAMTRYPIEEWMLNTILETEDHETREFFKINGVKVFDPHG